MCYYGRYEISQRSRHGQTLLPSISSIKLLHRVQYRGTFDTGHLHLFRGAALPFSTYIYKANERDGKAAVDTGNLRPFRIVPLSCIDSRPSTPIQIFYYYYYFMIFFFFFIIRIIVLTYLPFYVLPVSSGSMFPHLF